MSVLKNGEHISDITNILLDKWLCTQVEDSTKVTEPGYCVFNNTVKAVQLLNKHINMNSKMVLHTDVDVDGVGTTYIVKKVLNYLGSKNHIVMINKEKVHGIQSKHVQYFQNHPIDLMIITDSSSNEIDLIKQMNCDVICVDHHDILHNDLSGTCLDGKHKYVIVNSTIDNLSFEEDKKILQQINPSAFADLEKYVGNVDMSCGLVIYELLRIYCVCYSDENLLKNLLLYQWAAITLFTDSISTLNPRNQWYLSNTVNSRYTEQTLLNIMQKINKYKATLDKSYILFSFAPIVNKAIRAGAGAEILNLILNDNIDLQALDKYSEIQNHIIDTVMFKDVKGVKTPIMFNEPYIVYDVTNFNVGVNYNGVVAMKLVDANNKNSAVYIKLNGDICKGSFRGRYQGVDYRSFFEHYASGIYAQGHAAAFGFEVEENLLKEIMSKLPEIEPKEPEKPYITLGNIPPSDYGVYHFTNIDEIKQSGLLWRIGIGNSKVKSLDEIKIRVASRDTRLIGQVGNSGKLFNYDVLGLECKAFSILSGNYFDIYIENQNKLEFYIRQVKER